LGGWRKAPNSHGCGRPGDPDAPNGRKGARESFKRGVRLCSGFYTEIGAAYWALPKTTISASTTMEKLAETQTGISTHSGAGIPWKDGEFDPNDGWCVGSADQRSEHLTLASATCRSATELTARRPPWITSTRRTVAWQPAYAVPRMLSGRASVTTRDCEFYEIHEAVRGQV